MNEISNNNSSPYIQQVNNNTVHDNSPNLEYNIEAHYSDNTKVSRPKLTVAEGPVALPNNHIYSDKEANSRIQAINTDIYESSKKEKAKHEFNRSLYFKIFGCVTLATAGIAGFGAIKKFFKKS